MKNSAIEQYNRIRPNYLDFTGKIESLLLTLLKSKSVNFHLVEKRTKSIESFESKIERKKDKYQDPLNEITDLCGVRIILYYSDDVDKIDKIIRANFDVDEDNSIDKSATLNEDQFGYLSYHYVVTVNNKRNNLPEWEDFKNIKCEIQVRTVLQHAWASISHELEYKKEYEIPSVLKRKLFRLAGLIELADESFQTIRDQHIEVSRAIVNKELIDNTKVYEELNIITLEEYLSKPNDSLEEIKRSSKLAGFHVNKDTKNTKKYLSEILKVLKMLGLKTITALDIFLKTASPKSENYLKLVYQENTSKSWSTSPSFTLLLLLLSYLNERELDEYGGEGWSTKIWSSVKRAIVLHNELA